MGEIAILDQHGQPIRASASETAHFAASRRVRELANWTPGLDSATTELDGERQTIEARAYDLERNHGVAAGAIQTRVDNIVGTGLRLSAKPDYIALGRTKEWADAWARNVEARWRAFADVPEFDAARRLTFGGSCALALRTCSLAGDAFALALWLPGRPGARYSTALQMIDPARVCTPDGTVNSAGLFEGIEFNDYGEPVAAHIRRAHPADVYRVPGVKPGWERVPWRLSNGRPRIVHLFEQRRVDQPRGKSIFASVMGAFRMLDHYQRMELQTAVVSSMIAAFVETPMSGDAIAELFGGGKEYVAAKSGWDVKLEGASVIPLFPGEKLNPFTPTRPNAAYAAFVEAVLRYIATGLNMPYELLMKDFSKTNYSSARAALLEAWRYFLSARQWLATYWCTPIYGLWLEEAIQRGEVEAPDFYENRAAYMRAVWVGPGRGWVDPMKEAQASRERMAGGVSTLETECAEQGGDWEEIMEQRAEESRRAAQLGLPDPHAGTDAVESAPEDGDGESSEGGSVSPEEFRAAVDAYGMGVRGGVITPVQEDEEYFRRMAGLPPPTEAVRSAWTRERTRRPITLAEAPGSQPATAAPGAPAPAPAQPPDPED